MPTGATSSVHGTHASTSTAACPPVQTHVQPQHTQQHTQQQAMQTANPQQAVQQVNMSATPYHQAYLPNAVDMSSFQNVDWSSMYGMGMYV